jgi:hypothetical protein
MKRRNLFPTAQRWVERFNIKCTVNERDHITIHGNIRLVDHHFPIPVVIDKVIGDVIDITSPSMPTHDTIRHVTGNFWCRRNVPYLSNVPDRVDGNVFLHETSIQHLHNVHVAKPTWRIGGTLYLPTACTHVVGLALLPGVSSVALSSRREILNVIHDPFSWQERLLEMGLVEQAQI